MIVASGQSVTTEFTTSSSTGAGVNADSTPSGAVYLNGTVNAASVTVTASATTGVYKAAVTLPSMSTNDVVSIVISATIGGVAAVSKVWEAVCGVNQTVAQTGDSFARIGSTGSGLTTLASASALALVRSGQSDGTNTLAASYDAAKTAATQNSVDNVATALTNNTINLSSDYPTLDDIPEDFGSVGAENGGIQVSRINADAVSDTSISDDALTRIQSGLSTSGAVAAVYVDTQALAARISGNLSLNNGTVAASLSSGSVTGNLPVDVQTIKTQAVSCSGAVTVPAGTLASTTNITTVGTVGALTISGGSVGATVNSATIATAVAAVAPTWSVDGISYQSYLVAMLAQSDGKCTETDNGNGTKTLVFYKQDNTTPALTIVVDSDDYTRAAKGTIG